MPTATDLVTDLPADFETFGQAVATSMADLLGGTTGQILAKNSNTDMDFVWIANDQGDITGITASSPLTGGGTSGAITVGIQDGTTAQKGAVQLENSTSSTSTTTAAVPASVKSAYDLANGAIPKTLIDAAGDLIVGTAADTAGRLAIGTNGQVLQSNGTTAVWATPASGATFAGCSIYNSTTQSIPNATNTAVTFNSEKFDTDGFHDTSTDTSRITIPTGKGGKYLIAYLIVFRNNGTGYRNVDLIKNGTDGFHSCGYAAVTSSSAYVGESGSSIVDLAAGDYFEMFVTQNSGGSLGTQGTADGTQIQVSYLGA